jgi:arylsulfatase A-like enzyme
VGEFALNIDLAPTILELAGAAVPPQVDGRSLVPFLRGQRPSTWRTDFLVEDLQGDLTGTLRTRDWAYTEWGSGELELYDMTSDPFQMDSRHRTALPSALASLAGRLHVLEACKGASCRE